jgi:hypothetical protein
MQRSARPHTLGLLEAFAHSPHLSTQPSLSLFSLAPTHTPLFVSISVCAHVCVCVCVCVCVRMFFLTQASIHAPVVYVPLNEPLTSDLCDGKVLVMDAVGEFMPRCEAAVPLGALAIILSVHAKPLFGPLRLRHIRHEQQVSQLAPEASLIIAADGTTGPGAGTRPLVVLPEPRLPIAVVCLPEFAAADLRLVLRVPTDVQPMVLLPRLLLARLEEQGYPKHLCKQALERVGNDLAAASGEVSSTWMARAPAWVAG